MNQEDIARILKDGGQQMINLTNGEMKKIVIEAGNKKDGFYYKITFKGLLNGKSVTHTEEGFLNEPPSQSPTLFEMQTTVKSIGEDLLLSEGRVIEEPNIDLETGEVLKEGEA